MSQKEPLYVRLICFTFPNSEVKCAKSRADLNAVANEALEQMKDRDCMKPFEDDYDEIICCGAAFYRKRCAITVLN